ncbi:MAG: hypothetical protein ACK5P7_12645 [Bdellovibrio sp.]|jgi:hypothetical protein
MNIKSAVLILAALTTLSCQKKEIDSISEAQDCLDTSTPTTALECMQKVEGLESEGAYLIRCSANFIYQEFTSPTRLSNIAEQMKAENASPLAAIGLLAFSKPADPSARAALSASTMDYCAKAKSKGMHLLASMAQIATVASTALADQEQLVNDCNPELPGYNETTCQASAKEAICEASPAVIGAAALAAYQQSCLGSSQQSSSVCAEFASITNGTTDPATIGTNLQNEGGACP